MVVIAICKSAVVAFGGVVSELEIDVIFEGGIELAELLDEVIGMAVI